MWLSAPEYIDHMNRLGLFSASAPLPELNTAVWQAYLQLYRQHVGPPEKIEILATAQGLGVYRDPLNDSPACGWALLGPISHPQIPFSAAALIEQAPALAALLEKEGLAATGVVTETFAFAGDAGPAEENHFTWINSPQARLHESFDTYAASLAGKRRKQMRRLYREYAEDGAFTFVLSDAAPDEKETAFILENTEARWKEDSGYALVQMLWPLAVSRVMPDRARYIRVFHNDNLLFINAYIVRAGTIISQATCKNEAFSFSGLGTLIDFKAIETLANQKEIFVLDPTCRTGIDDPEDIGIAKREVINGDFRRPVFFMGARALGFLSHVQPAALYDLAAGWQPLETPVILGKTV